MLKRGERKNEGGKKGESMQRQITLTKDRKTDIFSLTTVAMKRRVYLK